MKSVCPSMDTVDLTHHVLASKNKYFGYFVPKMCGRALICREHDAKASTFHQSDRTVHVLVLLAPLFLNAGKVNRPKGVQQSTRAAASLF